ncbi:DNA polymerase III subunit gamma/tau [Subtercola boreus]|uniref:DNA-directed DNA polymerase n=1 Tax=Subtercola boreus TaxID=120213 RepID=A0A3E0W4I0_9MICO|nr:DNA polymerase III subunit gamma and tau [Subtercola boreus]RFA16423.1 DNA polymerase III subunit gamma/tau [Subtercola boreus]
MVTALYRRYRPETFGEMIGQSQVTEPLMTALRTNRVNHAYLFSGPRGCGKTTSARILARCLNCAEGPTDTPCGVCPSCVELSRDGSGSLDVVEIDAASHNGVDDARDLRERAVFAPARDRYKIFILDEAHMVTPQGFNALLKIVEEPPEHIKFIFATTEPDKVIGTIRSRTHHYPFRLIPPAQLLEYVQALCEIEGITAAPGVLPLVVRAGGGSARDTLSLLDQLIAGSESNNIEYERAVALLGYTHASLLGEVIDALGAHDSEGAFGAVDRVIQTGQDPRRFVEDLLERLRDVIIVSATRSAEGAAAVLRGMPSDDILQMQQQAALFGSAELSRTADIVNAALTEMTGATSPRLHLELMIARVLVLASDDTARGALARVERLERRVGVDGAIEGAPTISAGGSSASGSSPAGSVTAGSAPAGSSAGRPPAPGVREAGSGSGSSNRTGSGGASGASWPARASDSPPERAYSIDRPSGSFAVAGAAAQESAAPAAPESSPTASISDAPTVDASTVDAPTGEVRPAGVPAAPMAASSGLTPPATAGSPVTFAQLRDSWPQILETVEKSKRSAWMIVYTGSIRALEGDVLTLTFPSQNDVDNFKQQQAPGQGVSEVLRQAIVDVLGLRVKFIARVDATNPGSPEARAVAGGLAAGGSPAAGAGPDVGRPAASAVTPPVAASPATAARVSAPSAPVATPTPVPAAPTSPGRQQQAAAGAPLRRPATSGGAPTTSWPVVAIPVSSPEPEEPVRVGSVAVDIPRPANPGPANPGSANAGPVSPGSANRGPTPSATATPRSEIPASEIPDDIPEDIPEGNVPDFDPSASWAGSDDDIPLAAGPSDESFGLPSGAPRQNPIQPPATSTMPRSTPPAATGRPARPAASDRPVPQFGEKQRYGEAVVREILGASFIEERPVVPRRAPEREG